MPNVIHKIQGFVRRNGLEGPQRLKAYIPSHIIDGNRAGSSLNCTGHDDFGEHDPIGVSGVTLATGFDCGQTNVQTLRSIGVDDAVINQLHPFLGKKDKDAVEVFHRLGGLTVSQEVADMLDDCMHRHHYDLISAFYNKESGIGVFESLPWQAQAVIFSLCYNYGCAGFRKRASNTWAALVRQDWKDAVARLTNRSLWSEEWAKNRRGIEGQFLKEMC